MFYVNSILVIIIGISAKCIFDKWFVLIIEFVWSDNDRVNRVIFLVNCSADLVRICDSRTESILKLFTVPFLNIKKSAGFDVSTRFDYAGVQLLIQF